MKKASPHGLHIATTSQQQHRPSHPVKHSQQQQHHAQQIIFTSKRRTRAQNNILTPRPLRKIKVGCDLELVISSLQV